VGTSCSVPATTPEEWDQRLAWAMEPREEERVSSRA
jgi:hypothetical protein